MTMAGRSRRPNLLLIGHAWTMFMVLVCSNVRVVSCGLVRIMEVLLIEGKGLGLDSTLWLSHVRVTIVVLTGGRARGGLVWSELMLVLS